MKKNAIVLVLVIQFFYLHAAEKVRDFSKLGKEIEKMFLKKMEDA